MTAIATRIRRLPLSPNQVAAVVGLAFITSIGAVALLGYMLWRARS